MFKILFLEYVFMYQDSTNTDFLKKIPEIEMIKTSHRVFKTIVESHKIQYEHENGLNMHS